VDRVPGIDAGLIWNGMASFKYRELPKARRLVPVVGNDDSARKPLAQDISHCTSHLDRSLPGRDEIGVIVKRKRELLITYLEAVVSTCKVIADRISRISCRYCGA
jgi:hypothetical protein